MDIVREPISSVMVMFHLVLYHALEHSGIHVYECAFAGECAEESEDLLQG